MLALERERAGDRVLGAALQARVASERGPLPRHVEEPGRPAAAAPLALALGAHHAPAERALHPAPEASERGFVRHALSTYSLVGITSILSKSMKRWQLSIMRPWFARSLAGSPTAS